MGGWVGGCVYVCKLPVQDGVSKESKTLSNCPSA